MAISSNDIASHPDDSPEMMKKEAAAQGYAFPYLYDQTQSVAQAYRAACTPDIFVFDSHNKLAYRGQIDDSRPRNGKPVTGADLRAALDAILANSPNHNAPASVATSSGRRGTNRNTSILLASNKLT